MIEIYPEILSKQSEACALEIQTLNLFLLLFVSSISQKQYNLKRWNLHWFAHGIDMVIQFTKDIFIFYAN